MEKKYQSMVSYSFYRFYKFKEYTRPEQIQFLGTYDKTTTPTKICKSKLQNIAGFEVFDVSHDSKVTKSGYFIPETGDDFKYFDYYYVENRFKAYKASNMPITLFECSYKVVDRMLTMIGGFYDKTKTIQGEISLEKIDIDLDMVIKNAKLIGAWFNVDQMNLKSTGTFGNDVDQSAIFKDIKKFGNLSAVSIVIPHDGEVYTVMISKNGSITFQSATDLATRLEISQIIIKLILEHSN